MPRTIRYTDDLGQVQRGHRAPNNHLGRRIVQRQSGASGPVTRYKPGTPEYAELLRSKERQGT